MKAKIAKLSTHSARNAQGFLRLALGGQSKYFYQLAAITLLIVVFGLVFLLSSSSIVSIQNYGDAFYLFRRQALFALVGFALLTLTSLLPTTIFRPFTNIFFLGAVAIQAGVALFGQTVNGNKAWITLPFIGSVQPSEFLKLALILKLAQVLSDRANVAFDKNSYTWYAFWPIGLSVATVMFGGDLGTTIVFTVVSILMVYLSGGPTEHLRLPIAVILVGATIAMFSGTRLARIQAWLTGGMDDTANDLAWQSVHGVWAVAAGGLFGVGIGQSKMKWSWIPEVENDYIFAIIAEEGGLLLALITMAAFAFLGFTLFRIFQRCEGSLQKLITLGVLCWIVIQATINIGVVLQIFPVLGVPLPLISQGGSSMIAALAAIGVVLGFERNNHQRLEHQATRSWK